MRDTNAKKNKLVIMATVALATLALGGCAGAPWDKGSASRSAESSEIALQRAEIESQKAELARREEALAQQLAQLEAQSMQATDASSETQSGAMATSAGDSSGLIPPDPTPGECYAQVIIPAKIKITNEKVVKREASERLEITQAEYEEVEETVVVKEASTRLEVIPAQYETVEEQVLVKPATTRLEVMPAQYETVQERVMIKPAITKTKVIPAVYKTVEETVVDEPARREWKRVTDIDVVSGNALASASQTIQRYGDYTVLETRVEDTGVMCLVEIEATYKTVEKEVLVTPAKTIEETVPDSEEYKTVEKRVLTRPATKREVTIPAEYRTVTVTREIRPASTREVVIPAEYGKVKVTRLVKPASTRQIPVAAVEADQIRKEKLSDASIEWRPVLCKINMTRENVSALQTALSTTGSCRCGVTRNQCPADGIIGPCTLKAAERFAKKEGLSWGANYITMDVIRALGLTF